MESIPAFPEVGLNLTVPVSTPIVVGGALDGELDEWDMPIFAFHDLDYIPSGYGGILAPYIETGPGTMRAAATLMGLDTPFSPETSLRLPTQQVICDLGCGDGEFLIGLLKHVNMSRLAPMDYVRGYGVDYNGPLIATANLNAITAEQAASWLVYDFNLDTENLLAKLLDKGVTHVFVYLVPKQLALTTVRAILEGLWEAGVVVCCHKFIPGYLGEVDGEKGKLRRDGVMDLCVFERSG